MAKIIQWTSTVVTDGRTEMSLSRSLSVEAIGTIEVTIRGSGATGTADTDKEVEIQPSTTADQVKFLAIASDRYGDDSNFLEYKANSAAASPIRLDNPITLAGAGAVSVLDSALTSLFFSSTMVEDATIQIVVGRDATP